jgi:hypothetical protein
MTLKSINSRYHHDYMLLQGSLARLDFFLAPNGHGFIVHRLITIGEILFFNLKFEANHA